MRGRSFLLAVGLLPSFEILAPADYLIVSRSANIRERPDGSARVLLKAKTGRHLALAQAEQQNGYYRVRLHGGVGHGWI